MQGIFKKGSVIGTVSIVVFGRYLAFGYLDPCLKAQDSSKVLDDMVFGPNNFKM